MNPFRKYDSWTAERISRHLLYWGLWGLFYVTINYLTKHHDDLVLWKWVVWELTVIPIKAGCAYFIAYGIMPRYLYRHRYFEFVAWSALTAIVFGALLYSTYVQIIYPYLLQAPVKTASFLSSFIYKGLELIHITALVLCIKFFQNHLHEQSVSNRLKEQKTAAELRYLKNQIQPHFLFNTLNNLYGMVLSRDEAAPQTIVKLSDMLSYMLYESEGPLVDLQEELDHLENFIALERLRYDRKLDLVYERGEVPLGLEIAPLMLLPFVENAFKHGPAKEEGRSQIDIALIVREEVLHFCIKNTYVEAEIDQHIRSGIGLANVQQRLDLLYPDRHRLELRKGARFEVHLEIDLTNKPLWTAS
ncbi:MAG: histidine kinase [Bacteroidota bacterium]